MNHLKPKKGYLYILASKTDGAIYVGVTSDLMKRVYEHKYLAVGGHTKLYHIKRLVYFEEYEDVRDAIKREKQIKKWSRAWTLDLIVKDNPKWLDLYDEIT